MAAIEATTAVHRIGRASLANLALKPSEAALEPPGFSVLLGGTPGEAANQMRRVFADPQQFARLHAQSATVASATVEEIRRAGFDVIPVPTARFPNHGRVTHAAGASAFTPENLVRLHAINARDTNAGRMTMWIRTGQTLSLVDRSGRDLATARVDRLEGSTLSGKLTPGQDYSIVRELFHQWISSANDQLLTDVDRLDGEIAALGLRLIGPGGSEANVADFQPGEDMFTLRIEPEMSRNGAPVVESGDPIRSHTPGRN